MVRAYANTFAWNFSFHLRFSSSRSFPLPHGVIVTVPLQGTEMPTIRTNKQVLSRAYSLYIFQRTSL